MEEKSIESKGLPHRHHKIEENFLIDGFVAMNLAINYKSFFF